MEGNTVGSLAEKSKAIIIGCVLGDGAMRCKKNALLEINHSSKQKNYVNWKFEALQSLVNTPPKLRKSGRNRIACRFTTRSLPTLTSIYKRFYKSGKKEIPKDLKLKPLSLAVFFMDDGCKSYNALYLNTQKYSLKSHDTLIRLLRKQHEVKASINKDKKYYRLRIAVGSVDRFKNIIEPYLLPEFRYKLP